MDNNRIIGIELVVDDKGTTQIVRFADGTEQSMRRASKATDALTVAVQQSELRAKNAAGAMEQLERRSGTLTSNIKLMGSGLDSFYQTGASAFTRLRQAGGTAFDRLYQSGRSTFERLRDTGKSAFDQLQQVGKSAFERLGVVIKDVVHSLPVLRLAVCN